MNKLYSRKTYWEILKEVFNSFIEDNPMLYASNIAFYTIFSLPAALIIIITVAGRFFAEEAVTGELYFQVKGLVGPESAKEIQNIIEKTSKSETGFIATIVGIATLIFSATTVFVSIQVALNAIWKVKPVPKKGYVKFILDRISSFGLVVTFGFLMMISLVLDALLAAFQNVLKEIFSGVTFYVMEVANFAISFFVVATIFAMIYKFLPDAKLRWSDVRIGAIITTILFIIGKFLISFYIGNSDFEDTYGAAGSLVAILMWVYYSSVILLLGAAFTQAYARSRGRIIRPSKHAVKIEIKEVEIESGK